MVTRITSVPLAHGPEVAVVTGPLVVGGGTLPHWSIARQRWITLGTDGRESFATPLVPMPPANGTLRSSSPWTCNTAVGFGNGSSQPTVMVAATGPMAATLPGSSHARR